MRTPGLAWGVTILICSLLLSIGVSVGVAAIYEARNHKDRQRISQLEEQVHFLCTRRVVADITVTGPMPKLKYADICAVP